jgi:hypothetical protein
VLQAQGVILESGVAVGHGWVAGVAGFGEEAEVREAQFLNKDLAGLALEEGRPFLHPRMEEGRREQADLGARQDQEEGGFAHGGEPTPGL